MSKHKKKKRITFRIHSEMKKYRGVMKTLAEKLGKNRSVIYYQLDGRHIPKYVNFQIPCTQAFNEITGGSFTPEELFSINK